MGDYILLSVDSVEKTGEFYEIILGNDSVLMRVKAGQIFFRKDGTKTNVLSLKPGEEIFVKLFDSNGVNPTAPSKKDIEKIFFSVKKYRQLPDLVLNN